MSPRALNMFQGANVAVLQTNKDFVKDVIEAYSKDELVELTDELVELTEGCHHARHR